MSVTKIHTNFDLDEYHINLEQRLDKKKLEFENIGKEFLFNYQHKEINLKEILETFGAMYSKYSELCSSFEKCKIKQLKYLIKLSNIK